MFFLLFLPPHLKAQEYPDKEDSRQSEISIILVNK